jgi:hypothetical protein
LQPFEGDGLLVEKRFQALAEAGQAGTLAAPAGASQSQLQQGPAVAVIRSNAP